MFFDAIGDIAWAIALTLLGYYVASKVPSINKYIDPVLVAVVIIFLTPTIYHILKDPKIRAALFHRNRSK